MHGTGQRQLGVLQAEAVQAMEKERDRLKGRKETLEEIERKRKRGQRRAGVIDGREDGHRCRR